MRGRVNRRVFIMLVSLAYLAAMCSFVEACRPPSVRILSPKGMIYATKSIPLIFTVDKTTSWIGYSLDGQMNVTISGNTTLADLGEGKHYVVVYANDTAGRMGASCKVYFSVDTMPPNITNICQFPPDDNVLPEDEVEVNATVTDDVSGVKRVTLFYAYTNTSGVWIETAEMTNIEADIWSATIPSFPYCTNVTYAILAEDNVGNVITTVEMGYNIQYHVIPEFPSILIMPILITATLLTGLFRKRKQRKT